MRIMCVPQILARQQVEKTRLAFVEYQRAHDAHAEAKAAAAAVESRLMASSGARARATCAATDARCAYTGAAHAQVALLSTPICSASPATSRLAWSRPSRGS